SNLMRYTYVNQVNTSMDREVNAIAWRNDLSLTSTFDMPYNLTFRIRNVSQFNRVETNNTVRRTGQSSWLFALQHTVKLGSRLVIQQSLDHYSWRRRHGGTPHRTTFLDAGTEWYAIADQLSFTAKISNA